jgi:hypothetical protein
MMLPLEAVSRTCCLTRDHLGVGRTGLIITASTGFAEALWKGAMECLVEFVHPCDSRNSSSC